MGPDDPLLLLLRPKILYPEHTEEKVTPLTSIGSPFQTHSREALLP